MTTPAKELAKLLARYGRHGDTELVHMTKSEVHALKLLSGIASGSQSINPDTGLPEAFDLKWLIPIAAIAAIALTGGAAAAPLAAGAGTAGAATGATAAGLGAGLGTAAGTTAAATGAGLATGAELAATAAPAILGDAAVGTGLAATTAGTAAPAVVGSLPLALPEVAAPIVGEAAGIGSTLGEIGAFAAENPLLTLGGLSMAGSMFEEGAPKQEPDDPYPTTEYGPGGVRQFQPPGLRVQNPDAFAVAPTPGEIGERDYFSYEPAPRIKLQRRFATGGLATGGTGQQLLAQRAAINPRGTYDIHDPANAAARYARAQQARAAAGRSGAVNGDLYQRMMEGSGLPGKGGTGTGAIPPSASAPAVARNPNSFVQGVIPGTTATPTPSMPYSPVRPSGQAPAGQAPAGMPPIAMPNMQHSTPNPTGVTPSQLSFMSQVGQPLPQSFAVGGPVMPGAAPGGVPLMPPPENPAPLGVPTTAPLPDAARLPPAMPQAANGPKQPLASGGGSAKELVTATVAALKGEVPNPEQVIAAFVAKFGQDALQKLIAIVQAEPAIPENMAALQGGRLMSGPGGGVEDAIPAQIDGAAPAALSSGEFVVPAAAVSGLGDGSTEAGARKLQGMVNRVNRAKGGSVKAPPPIKGRVLPA